MDNAYIDNTIEVMIKAFEENKMESLEQYKKLKEIKENRRKLKKYEK